MAAFPHVPSRRLLPLLVVALLVTAGCSQLTTGDAAMSMSTTDVRSFETVGTTCGDVRSTNTSSASSPAPGGRTLTIDTTIPVRSNATTLDARLDEIGTHRYRLDVSREGGSGVPDCYLETRFTVTVNLTDDATDRYTLLVTYDGVLVSAYVADPGGSGAVGGLAPETRYAPWARNVSDANGGLGGDGSGNDDDSGDAGSGHGGGASG